MSSPARALDLLCQEPAVLRMRYGRQVGMVVQIALMVAFLWARPFEGQLDTRLILLFEALLIGGLAFSVVRTVRRFRAQDRNQASLAGSLRGLVFNVFPAPIAHVFMSEITIWIGLWKLVSRPFRARQNEFAYHGRLDLGMLLVVIVTAPVEILLFELLIPWAPVRWLLLVAAVYSVLWFAGITFAPMIYQHVAKPAHLVLRNGAATSIPIRYANIAAIEPFVAPWPDMTGRFPPTLVVREDSAWLQFGGQSALRIQLREPRRVGNDSAADPVTSIVFAADQPAALIRPSRIGCWWKTETPGANAMPDTDFR